LYDSQKKLVQTTIDKTPSDPGLRNVHRDRAYDDLVDGAAVDDEDVFSGHRTAPLAASRSLDAGKPLA